MMTVWVTGQFAALHYWPKAYGKVDYLQYIHRHLFHFKVEIEVNKLDREIEFLELKHTILKICEVNFCKHPTTFSCEQMCEILKDIINQQVDIPLNSIVSVTVSEDGENGATWHRD